MNKRIILTDIKELLILSAITFFQIFIVYFVLNFIFDKLKFNKTKKINEKLIKENKKIHICKEFLLKYRIHNNQYSNKYRKNIL